jgi:P4 family phage/plasmid primase-like protien
MYRAEAQAVSKGLGRGQERSEVGLHVIYPDEDPPAAAEADAAAKGTPGEGAEGESLPGAEVSSAGSAHGRQKGRRVDRADPHFLAQSFLKGRTWRFWKGSYWKYEDGRYVEVAEAEVKAQLTAHIQKQFERAREKEKGRRASAKGVTQGNRQHGRARRQPDKTGRGRPRSWHVTTSVVNNTLLSLRSLTLLSDETPMPSLLGSGPRNLLALRNGILDLDTRELLDHTPDYFSTVRLPYDYDSEAKCPAFLRVVNRLLGDDREVINLMQEWFGYCLAMTTDAQSFLLLYGQGGTGKSTLLAALAAVVGEDNVSAADLEDFNKEFGLANTLGKLVNICGDLPSLNQVHEGRLKRYTDGTKMAFNRKNLPVIDAHPTARLTFSTNTLPRFTDRTNAVYRRLILVPMNVKVTGEGRKAGMDKPAYWERSGELPGILNWALDGQARLRDRGWQFLEPRVCRQAKEEYRLDNDPTRRFLVEHFRADHGAEPISSASVCKWYQEWCKDNGHKPMSCTKLTSVVKGTFPGAHTKDRRAKTSRGSKVVKHWHGIRPL